MSASKPMKETTVAPLLELGYPTFTTSMDARMVAWLVATFHPPFVEMVRFQVHRDWIDLFSGEESVSSVRVTLDRQALGSLRTRRGGQFVMDAFKFIELVKQAKGKTPYRFRMDGDGILYVGTGHLTRSFSAGGEITGPPPEDFLVVSEDLNPKVPAPDLGDGY